MSDNILKTLKESWGRIGGHPEQKTDISYILRNYPKNPGDLNGADKAIIKFINKFKRIPEMNEDDINSISEIMANALGEDLDFCKHEVQKELSYFHKNRGVAGLKL